MQGLYRKYVWNAEERGVNLENPKVQLNGYNLDQILGGNTSKTGNVVSHNSILALSAVYRAVSIKSGFFASMPFQVFKRTENGRILSDHPAAKLLSRKPNNKLSKAIYMDKIGRAHV